MIGITVFSNKMIIFSTLKQFWKHFAHGQIIEVVFGDMWWRRLIIRLYEPIGRITWLCGAFGKQVYRIYPQCSNQIGQYAIRIPPVGRYWLLVLKITFSKYHKFFFKNVKQFGSRSKVWQNVRPDLDPNCLQKLSVDNTLQDGIK